MGLRDNDWAVKKIIQHEGFRVDPYTDTMGYITGGVGHKFTKDDFDNFNPNWTREEKMKYWEERFFEDLASAEQTARRLAARHNIRLDDEKILYVLTDMAFNLGANGLSKFGNFLKALGQGDIEWAILEMKQVSKDNPTPSRWYRQVPNRVDSLIEILRSTNESDR